MCSNPEFLKEGAAIEDCTKPDRVVVGVRRPEVGEVLHELYAPYLRTERPFLVMSPESAEMTKYVANAMLATKISFINEMANLCEKVGADINDVRRGIGHDVRIGFQFLFPGAGYGGSCFPKDIRSLVHLAKQTGDASRIMQAIDSVNEEQKQVLTAKVVAPLRRPARGQDARRLGAGVQAAHRRHPRGPGAGADRQPARGGRPACASTTPRRCPTSRRSTATGSSTATGPTGRSRGPTAWSSSTEWQQFRNPDFELMRRLLAEPVIFDGRNLYELETMRQSGFTYYSIGRQRVRAEG